MTAIDSDYLNGYIQREAGGRYEGRLTIDGVNISPIEGVYFKKGLQNYLWLKRKPLLEYDFDKEVYNRRESKPKWEAYLKKINNGHIAYQGEFYFLHFRYNIVGIWDRVLGIERQRRLNLFVERLDMNNQTIINLIRDKQEGTQS